MSVLIFIRGFDPGVKYGGPTQSLSHLLQCVEQDVRVFTSAYDVDGTKLEVARDQWVCWPSNPQVKVFYCSSQRLPSLIVMLKEMIRIRPRVVWVNSFFDFNYSLLPQLAARLYGRRVVISPRGELMSGALSIKKWRKLAFLNFFKVVNKIFIARFHFTSAEELSEGLRFFGGGKSYLFENYARRPIDKSQVVLDVARRATTKRIVFLGRLVPKKGLDLALKILSRLESGYTLEIYGEFEDQRFNDDIRVLVGELGLEERITYRGFIPFNQAVEEISSCLLMLAPTRGENFGHSIYECLSIGLPVVVSDRTPWKASLGVRVCTLTNVESYVEAISDIRLAESDLYAQDALSQAQGYFDKLPDPAEFLEVLVSDVPGNLQFDERK